jgi:hypothetical protein
VVEPVEPVIEPVVFEPEPPVDVERRPEPVADTSAPVPAGTLRPYRGPIGGVRR